jgi:hypothetical protein
MKLRKLDYAEFEGGPQEWKLEACTFGDINLVVGRNATGKTRTLNVVKALANLLSEKSQLEYNEGKYAVEFDRAGESISYCLEYHRREVASENLVIGPTNRLQRGADGKGWIYAQQFGQNMDFQLGQNQLAASAKRDKIQHPFLEDLYTWGKGLRRYDFGSSLGKDTLMLPVAQQQRSSLDANLDLKDAQQVLEIFRRGKRDYHDDFVRRVIDGMNQAGYELSDIGLGPSPDLTFGDGVAFPVLYVREDDRAANTYQTSMSSGMFRTLSVLIQVNYSLLAGEPSCILIDDIGEGLDFSRSSALVKLLIDKVEGTSTQLIMATNDRFIMNSVPLQYWIVLERRGGRCIPHNYENSRDLFERFELTGLSNFDFFTSGEYLLGV